MLLLVFLVPGLLGALVHGQSTFALNDQIFKLESPFKSSPSSNSACPDRAPPRSAGLPRGAGGASVKSALNFLSAAVYGIGHLYSSCLQPGIFHRFIPISERLTLQIV